MPRTESATANRYGPFGLNIIRSSEATVRTLLGIVLMGYASWNLPATLGLVRSEKGDVDRTLYAWHFGVFLVGSMMFNTGIKYQCGMVILGLWNIDGAGYSRIPDEYREHLAEKQAQFVRDTFLLVLFVSGSALALPYATSRLDLALVVEILHAIIWVAVLSFTSIYGNVFNRNRGQDSPCSG